MLLDRQLNIPGVMFTVVKTPIGSKYNTDISEILKDFDKIKNKVIMDGYFKYLKIINKENLYGRIPYLMIMAESNEKTDLDNLIRYVESILFQYAMNSYYVLTPTRELILANLSGASQVLGTLKPSTSAMGDLVRLRFHDTLKDAYYFLEGGD